MSNYHSNQEAFDIICGDCAGSDINEISEADVRAMAEQWRESGEECSDQMIEDAIEGLREYQEAE